MSPHFLFHKYGFNHFCPLLERQSNIFDFASRNTCNVAIRPSAVVNLFQFFFCFHCCFQLSLQAQTNRTIVFPELSTIILLQPITANNEANEKGLHAN